MGSLCLRDGCGGDCEECRECIAFYEAFYEALMAMPRTEEFQLTLFDR